MKTSHKIMTIALSVITVVFATSCSTKKSTDSDNQTGVKIATATSSTLASCNYSADANFAYNLAAVFDNYGAVNSNWLKLKFQSLSSNVKQSGYLLRFFKWRVVGSSAQLDATPLTFTTYDLSTGQTSSADKTSMALTSVSSSFGFYINLNDDTVNPYQVLKVVAYKADGSIAAQSNILIPQFAASPIDYQTNKDGSTRDGNLQKIHPLFGVNTTGWTPSQYDQNFQQYCF